jgi:hypothetical protein
VITVHPLAPRLGALAGLGAHLLDDVVTAGQRRLRFEDLGDVWLDARRRRASLMHSHARSLRRFELKEGLCVQMNSIADYSSAWTRSDWLPALNSSPLAFTRLRPNRLDWRS